MCKFMCFCTLLSELGATNNIVIGIGTFRSLLLHACLELSRTRAISINKTRLLNHIARKTVYHKNVVIRQ